MWLKTATQWLDQVALVEAWADERRRMQARFVSAGALVGAVLCSLVTLALGLQGSWDQAAQSTAGVIICLVVLMVWRAVRNPTLIAHLFGVSVSINYFSGTIGSGQIGYVSLFAIVPLVTLFLAGRRVGGVWLVISMILVVAAAVWLRPPPGEVARLFDAHVVRIAFLLPTVFFVGVVYDLGQERAFETLTRALDAAEAASREKSRFLAKVSHEIRTPLNGVLGTAELAMLEDLPAHTKAQLATIHRSGGTLLALINDLLDVARAEAGRFDLNPMPFSPGPLVAEVVALHQASATARGLQLTHAVEVPGQVTLLGDAVRLKQVLGNLVSNAIKFTPAGAVHVRCEGVLDDGAYRLRWSVTDSGPGISLADQARLFQPFSQLGQHTAGTGLGLAISRTIVEAMKGRLLVTSGPGRGSTFTLEATLPVTQADPHHTPVAQRWTFTGRVLVVDDNPVNLAVATGLLGKLGVETLTAVDGQLALEVLNGQTVDLVLMDLQMPVMDGLEATRALRQRGVTTPIVALTASAMRDELQACRDAGMQDCLTKPLRLTSLIETLLQHLPNIAARSRLA